MKRDPIYLEGEGTSRFARFVARHFDVLTAIWISLFGLLFFAGVAGFLWCCTRLFTHN